VPRLLATVSASASASAQVGSPGEHLQRLRSYPGLWRVLWSGRVKCPASGWFIVVPLGLGSAWWRISLPISADCGLSAVSIWPPSTGSGLWFGADLSPLLVRISSPLH